MSNENNPTNPSFDPTAWGDGVHVNKNGQSNNDPKINGFTAIEAIADLLSSPSIMTDNRVSMEINTVVQIIKDEAKSWNDSSMEQFKKRIIPSVTTLDQTLSPRLPAFLLSIRLGDFIFAMPTYLFSRSSIMVDEETINLGLNGLGVAQPGVYGGQVMIPRTPIKLITAESISAIKKRQTESNDGVQATYIVAGVLIDLDTIVDFPPNVPEAKENVVAKCVLREWENAVRIQVAKIQSQNKRTIGTIFIDKDKNPTKMYGKNDLAIVKAEAITSIYCQSGVPTSSNLKVTLRTRGLDNNINNQEAQRDIVTTTSNVTFAPVPFALYKPTLVNGALPYQYMNMSPDFYVNGYRPFQPIVVLNTSSAGQQMGNNDGIASFIMALYATLTTNNRYIWSDAVRSTIASPRGTLVDLDRYLDNSPLAQPCPNYAAMRKQEFKLTDERLKDIDFVTGWLNRNVSPNFALAVDLPELSTNSALMNALILLSFNTPSKMDEKTNRLVVSDSAIIKNLFIEYLDKMTEGKFSAQIDANVKEGKVGWTPSDPILTRTSQLIPQGTYIHNGFSRSLGETDVMSLSHQFKKTTAPIETFIRAMNGDGVTDEATRRYLMTINLSNIHTGGVNITNFAPRTFLDPKFLELLVTVFNKCGSLQVSGLSGIYNAENLIASPGLNFVTSAYAGGTGTIGPAGVVGGPSTMFQFGII